MLYFVYIFAHVSLFLHLFITKDEVKSGMTTNDHHLEMLGKYSCINFRKVQKFFFFSGIFKTNRLMVKKM